MDNQNTAPNQITTTDSQPITKQKGLIPKWVKVIGIMLIVFIAVIIIAAVVTTSATKAPQKVSDTFVNNFQASNTKAAYDLTSDSFKTATTQEQLEKLIQRVGPVVQGEEKVIGRSIQKASGKSTTAVILYSVNTSNGTKYIKVGLQKNGDVWQVVNFRSSDNPLDTKLE